MSHSSFEHRMKSVVYPLLKSVKSGTSLNLSCLSDTLKTPSCLERFPVTRLVVLLCLGRIYTIECFILTFFDFQMKLKSILDLLAIFGIRFQ